MDYNKSEMRSIACDITSALCLEMGHDIVSRGVWRISYRAAATANGTASMVKKSPLKLDSVGDSHT